MIYFLTTHGTLLTRGEDGIIGHAALRDVAGPGALFRLDVPVEGLRRDFRAFVERAAPPPVLFRHDDIAGSLDIDPDRNLVSLRSDGRVLTAAPQGGAIGWTDSTPDAWERLLPLTEIDLGQIVQLASNIWIVRSTHALVKGWQIEFAPGFVLRLGPIDIPLPANLPFDARTWPFRLGLLVDGWRVEELCLYRPMVFYTSYRSPAVHAQLFLSIRSLLEFGKYDGHVHVLTDLAHDALCGSVDGLDRDRATVQRLAPSDWPGFVMSKYCILEHDPAWQHQPVAYLDPDIVINADIRPMLIEMALSDHITAPTEDVGPMRTWPSVGASLIQRDGYDPRYARGFNAGTLGIPNLHAHAHTLRQIRRIIANILASDGREHLAWVDQEVANYVSFRVANFDTTTLNRFVRYGAPHDSEIPGILSGLVHFWATSKNERHLLMARYVDVLRSHAASGHHLS